MRLQTRRLVPAVAVLLLAACGSDIGHCEDVVQAICARRRACPGAATFDCDTQVRPLVTCAQNRMTPSCPAGTQYYASALDQFETDQQDATCQDLLAGKVAASCTQTCR